MLSPQLEKHLTENVIFDNFCFNSVPNDKFLDKSKLNAFVHDIINAAQKLEFALKMFENDVGKGLSAGHLDFLFFLPWLQKVSSTGC